MPLTETLLLPDSWLGFWQINETEEELMDKLEQAHLKEQLAGFSNAQRRREFAASRLLVSALLRQAGFAEEAPMKDESGKPFLKACPLSLSISHTGDTACALLSRAAHCGIDLEPVRPAILRLGPKFLSEAELKQVQGDPVLTTLYWSIKETVYKLYGKRQLQFNQHMQVQAFSPEAKGGTAFASLHLNGSTCTYPVQYQLRNELVLTWCTSPENKQEQPSNE